jgi:hypothetical protein
VDGSPLQIGRKARARLKIRVTDRQARLDAVAVALAVGGGMVNLPPVPARAHSARQDER